jgi:hypothetical protein
MSRGGVVGVAMIVALALASPVAAQEDPPSAVDQYAELVPTADGPKAPGNQTETRAPLPPAGSDALEQAPPAVAVPLEEVATSSSYGAPTPQREPQPPARDRDDLPSDPSLESTLASTFEAVGSTEDSRLLGLLVAIPLVALGAVALAVLRTRAPS